MSNANPQNSMLDPEALASLAEWHRRGRRLWAKILSTVLTLSFVFPYLTWAFETKSYSSEKMPAVTCNAKSVTIPESFGTIRHSYQGGDKVIVHIQDLHCNYEVQMNIARMIDSLAKEHNMRVVAVEGASTPLNVSKLGTFPVREVKENVGKLLVKQGQIGGPEYYAATGANRIRLQGIENEAMYRQALKTVQGFLNAESQGYCYDLREILDELKDKLYNAPLKRYDEQRMAFREDRMSLLEYCTLMAKYAKRQRRSLETYPNVAVYIQKNQTAFPIAVDIDGLYRELDQLDAEIRASLYTTADQKQLDRFYRRIDLIEKMINISATPEEVAEFNADRTGFDVKKFAEFIRRHDAQGELAVDPDVYNLDIYMQQVDNFYRMTDQRSEQFVANLLKAMEKQHQNIAVMVSGGFHTDGVLQCLKQRGCSYVSVIPRILQQNVTNPYFQLLQGRKQPLEKLLAKNQTMLALALRSAQGDPEAVITEANLEQFMPGAAPETFNRVKDFLELQQLLLNIAAVDSALNHNAVEQVAVKVKEMLADYPANVPGLNPLAGMTPEQAAKVLGEPNAVLPLPGMPSSMVRCAKNAFKDLKIEDQRIAFDDKHDYVLMSNAAIQAHRAQLARSGRAAAQLPSFQWAQSAVGALMATGMGTVAQVGSGVQNAFRNFNGGNLLDSLRSGLLGGVLDENGALKPTVSVVAVALAAAGAVIAGVVVAVAIFGMPIIPVAAVSTVLMVGVSMTLFFGLNFGPGTAATAPQSGFFGEQTSEALRKALLVATRWGAHDLTALSMTEDLAERTVRLLFNELTPKQVESFFAFFGHEVRGEDDFTIADELLQNMQHGLEKSPRRLMLIAQAQDCLDRLRNGEEIEFFVNDRAFNLHSLKVVQVKQTDHVSESIRKGLDQVGAFLQVQDGTGIVYVMPDVDPAEALVHEVLEFLVGVPHEKVTALFEAARIGEIEKPAEADVRGKIVARTKATLASAWKDMNYLKGSEWEKQAEQVNQMIWDLDKLEYDDIIDILKSWPSPKYSDLLPSLSLTGQAVFNANRMALLASVLAAAFQNPSVLHNIQSGRDLIEALPSEVRQQPSFALAQAMGLMSFDSEVFELVLGKLNLQQKEHLLDILASSAMIFRPYDPALNQGAEPLARMKAHWGWLQVKNQFLLHDRILSIIRSAAGLNSRIGNFKYDDTPVFRTTYQEAKLKTQSGFGALRGETGRQLLTDSIIRALGVTLLPGRTAMEFIAELTDEQVEKYFGTRHATAKEWIEDWSQSRFTLTHEYIPQLFVKRKNPLDNPFESRKPESKKRYPFHPAADKIMQWICENPERFIVLAPGKYTEEMKAAQADQDFEHLGVLHFNGTVYIAQHAMSKLTERNLLVPVLMHEVAEMGVAGKSLSHDEAVALVEGATRFNNEALISKMETELGIGALLGSEANTILGRRAQNVFRALNIAEGIGLEPGAALARFSEMALDVFGGQASWSDLITAFFAGYSFAPLRGPEARTVENAVLRLKSSYYRMNLKNQRNALIVQALDQIQPEMVHMLSPDQFKREAGKVEADDDLMRLGMFHLNGKIFMTWDVFEALRREPHMLAAALLHESLEMLPYDGKRTHTQAGALVEEATITRERPLGITHAELLEKANLNEKAARAEKKPGMFEQAKTGAARTLADMLLDKFSMGKANFKGETSIMRPDFNVPIRISDETPIEWKQKDGKYVVANADKLKYTIPEGADARIVEALPSLLEAAQQPGNKGLVLIFHMEQKIDGPDKKEVKFTPSTEPIAAYLREKIGPQIKGEVKFVKGSITAEGVSEEAIRTAENLREGDVLVMENARICKAEKADLKKVTQEAIDKYRAGLERLGTQFIFAAFGAIHRDHVSLMLSRSAKFAKKSYLDFLVGNEVSALDKLRQPDHPFYSVVAGSKVKDKIEALEQNLNLMKSGDKIFIAGRMAFAFVVAQREMKANRELSEAEMMAELGNSGKGISREDINTAKRIMKEAETKQIKVLLPVDGVVVADLKNEEGEVIRQALSRESGAAVKAADGISYKEDSIRSLQAVPAGHSSVDIGPETVKLFLKEMEGGKTVSWNGPLGVFEENLGGFMFGTVKLGEAVAKLASAGSTVVIGGGDSALAIKQAAKLSAKIDKAMVKSGEGLENKIYVSTGGGAVMAFLKEGFNVPGLKVFLERFATHDVAAESLKHIIKFGTSGWRALVTENKFEFNEDNVGRVAQASAESLLEQVAKGELKPKDGNNLRVLVAYDGRPVSRKFAVVLAEVLMTNGIEVTLGDDIATTPGVAAMTKGGHSFDFAFHVTASHNTKAYNGIKLLQDGAVAPDDQGTITKIIEAKANQLKTYRRIPGISAQAPGTDVAAANTASYNQVLEAGNVAANLKNYLAKHSGATIEVDVFHGAAGPFVAPLKNLGIKIHREIPMRDLAEGALPDDYRPDPTSDTYKKTETYLNFANKAKDGSLLIGIDGDGDRVAVWVKKDGQVRELTPNDLMVLYGWHNIKEVVKQGDFKGKKFHIVKAQQATNAMKKMAEWGRSLGLDIDLTATPTGSKFFGPFLKFATTLICAEPSGHMMMDGRFDDASYFAIKLLGIAGQYQEIPIDTVARAKKEIGFEGIFEQVNLDLVDEKGNDELDKLIKKNIVAPLDLNQPAELRNLADTVSGKIYPQNPKAVVVNVNVEKDGKLQVMELKKALANPQGLKIKPTEGMQWELPDGSWIQVRLSGTEPLIRIYSEARTNVERQKLEDAVRETAMPGTKEAKGKPAAEATYEDEEITETGQAAELPAESAKPAETGRAGKIVSYSYSASPEQMNQVEALANGLAEEKFSEGLRALHGAVKSAVPSIIKDAKLAGILAKIAFDGEHNRLGWTRRGLEKILARLGTGANDPVALVLNDAQKIRDEYKAKYVIFCGMGGSGLSVETVKTTFGEQDIKIFSLRTTDPAIIQANGEDYVRAASKEELKSIIDKIVAEEGSLEKALEKTLFVPISKSGTTQETVSHKEYFEQLLDQAGLPREKHMWVVTDKGSPMDTGDYEQSEIQLDGGEDIGGRFTAPTTRIFLLPLALVAPKHVIPMLKNALTMHQTEDRADDAFTQLGTFLYQMAKNGIDKVTFFVPSGLRDLPMWSEQLFEESLGKGGKGVTLFFGEDLTRDDLKPMPENDRVFVRINYGKERADEELWKYLKANGYPVFELTIPGLDYLGGLMMGLQRSVAVIGRLWDICFTDQPGVEGYKKSTRDVMKSGGRVEIPKNWQASQFGQLKMYFTPLLESGAITKEQLDAKIRELGKANGLDVTLETAEAPLTYAALLALKDELGIQAAEIIPYGTMSDRIRGSLQMFRTAIYTRGLKLPAKLAEGPDKNHSFHQNIQEGRNMFLSTYFMPGQYQPNAAKPVLGYDDNLIRAQTIGTVVALMEANRKVVLVETAGTLDSAQADIEKFNAEVAHYLGASVVPAAAEARSGDRRLEQVLRNALMGTGAGLLLGASVGTFSQLVSEAVRSGNFNEILAAFFEYYQVEPLSLAMIDLIAGSAVHDVLEKRSVVDGSVERSSDVHAALGAFLREYEKRADKNDNVIRALQQLVSKPDVVQILVPTHFERRAEQAQVDADLQRLGVFRLNGTIYITWEAFNNLNHDQAKLLAVLLQQELQNLDHENVSRERAEALVSDATGFTSEELTKAAGLKVPGSAVNQVPVRVNGEAKTVEVTFFAPESADGKSLPQFIHAQRRYEARLDGRTLQGKLYEIEGKTYLQMGDRWVSVDRTGLTNLPLEELAHSQVLLGNPSLRDFLGVETLALKDLQNGLPQGMSVEVELKGFVDTKYTDQQRHEALQYLRDHQILDLAAQGNDQAMLDYLDALMIVSHPESLGYEEFKQAVDGLDILLKISGNLEKPVRPEMLELIDDELTFFQKRKLGYPTLAMNFMGKKSVQKLIKTVPDNLGQVMVDKLKVEDLAGGVNWVKSVVEWEGLANKDALNLGHFVKYIMSEIGVAGEGSRVLDAFFRANKLFGPMVRVRQGMEETVKEYLQNHDVKYELWSDGKHSYLGIGHVVLARNENKYVIGGLSTLKHLAKLAGDYAKIVTQDLAHQLNLDGTFQKDLTLAGHGRLMELMMQDQPFIKKMVAQGLVHRHVQGDDLGNAELGGMMARMVRLGQAPMVVLTTPQKVDFQNDVNVIEGLLKQNKTVTINGKKVGSVRGDRLLDENGNEIMNVADVLANLKQADRQSRELLARAEPLSGDAQRVQWMKAMEFYQSKVYEPVKKLKYDVSGEGKSRALITIAMNEGGHLLAVDGENIFVEKSAYDEDVVELGGKEFPLDVFWALIPKNFNTNNFALDPLAIAANRDVRIKEAYQDYLIFAQANRGDETKVEKKRMEVEKLAETVIGEMSAEEWQARNLAVERLMMTVFPSPVEKKGKKPNEYIKLNMMAQNVAYFESQLALSGMTAENVTVADLDKIMNEAAAKKTEKEQTETKNAEFEKLGWQLGRADKLKGLEISRVNIIQVPENAFTQVKKPNHYNGMIRTLNSLVGDGTCFEEISLVQRQAANSIAWMDEKVALGLIDKQVGEVFKAMAREISEYGDSLPENVSEEAKKAYPHKLAVLEQMRQWASDENYAAVYRWSKRAVSSQGELTSEILSKSAEATVNETRQQNISTRNTAAIAAVFMGAGALVGFAGASGLLSLGLSFGAMAWVTGLAGAVLLPVIGVPFLVLAAGMWWAQRGSAMVGKHDVNSLDLSPAWRQALPMVEDLKIKGNIAFYAEEEGKAEGVIYADLLAISLLPHFLQNVILAHEMAHIRGDGELRAYAAMMKGLLGTETPQAADGLAGQFQRLSTGGKIFSGLGAGMIVFGLLIPLIPALAIPGVAIVVPGLITLGVGMILTAAPFFRPQAGGTEAAAGKTAAGELPAGLGEFVPGANEAQRTAVSLTQVVKSTLAFTPLIFGVVAAVQVTAGSFAINSDIWLRALAAVFGAFAANLAIGVVTNNRLIQEATSLSVLPEKAPAVKGTVNQLMAVTQFMLAKAGDGLNRALAGQVLEKGILGFSGLLGVSAAVLSGLGAAAVGLPVLIIALPLGLLATGGAYVYARVSTARYFVDTKADGEAALDAGLLAGERNNETLYDASAAGDVMIDPTNFIGSIMERIDAATGQRDVSPVTLNMKLDEWRAKGFGRELKTIIKILKSDKTLAEGTLLQRLQVILETEKGADLRTRTALEDAALAVALQRALGQGQGAIGEVDKAGWKNGQNQKRGYYITASPEMIAALIAQVKSAQTGKAIAELQVMEQALNRLQTAMKAYQAGEIIKIDAELAAEFMPYVENYARNTSRPGQIAFGENFEYNGKKEFKGAFLSGGHRTVKQTAADGKEIEVAAPGVYEATYETTGTEQLSAEADWTQNKQIRATDFLKTRTTPRVDFDRAGAVFNFMLAVSQGPLRGTVFGQAAKQWTLQHNRVEYWARIAESGRYPIIGKLLDKNNEESVLMEAMKDRYLDQTQCEREVLKAMVGMLKNNPELQTLDTMEEFTAFMEHLSVRLTGGLTLRMPATQKELHRQLPNALWDKGMKSRWGYMKDLFQRFDNNITLSDQLENILFRKQMLSASQAA